MKFLIAIWTTAITTFLFTSFYVLSSQERINVPGELGEVFSSAGIILFVLLIFVTVIGLVISLSKTKN